MAAAVSMWDDLEGRR